MIKKDFAKEALKLTFPKIATHKSVPDFVKSRKTLSETQLRAYEWDKPRSDPQVDLTASRRLFENTEQVLAGKRDFYKEMRLNLDEQWGELRGKEEELRQSFQNLNLFIVTNKDKRERAKERAKEDAKLRIKRTEEIETLRNKIAEIHETKKRMGQEIGKHIFYEKFLNQVVELEPSDGCHSNTDLINRYESLLKTKSELGERQEKFLQDIEEARSKIKKLNAENILYILGLHNVLRELNARYQKAASDAMRWESIVLQIKENVFRKFQEINEVKQAARNICGLMSRRKGEILRIEEDSLEKQLAYIKKTLQELRVVADEARISSKKTFSSMRGETSRIS